MKSITNKTAYSSIKARITAFTVCVALILCTFLSFMFINIGSESSGSAAVTTPGPETERGIRFTQVAAGEDFAIGLTYDGRLFAWSLLPEPEAVSKDSASTLGNYYPTVPTEIKVKFVAGPRGTTNSSNIIASDTKEYNTVTDDSVLQLAATRTTAAFITRRGYIYTWGKDQTKDVGLYTNEQSLSNYLLMRSTSASETSGAWCEPYIINYSYYGGINSMMSYMIPPQTTTNTLDNISIAGGENNYIFTFAKGGYAHTFVWGSLMYAVTNSNAADTSQTSSSKVQYSFDVNTHLMGGGSGFRKIYRTMYASSANDVSSIRAVAGGYTVGFNASAIATGTTEQNFDCLTNVTSLRLKGKNFITAQGGTYSGNDLTVVKTVNTPNDDMSANAKQGDDVFSQSIIGSVRSRNNATTVNGVDLILPTIELSSSTTLNKDYDPNGNYYYARQKAAESGDGTVIYSVAAIPANLNLVDSTGAGLEGSIPDGNPKGITSQPIRSAVALGNDIGYGISSGALYAWGDNTLGQLATTIDGQTYSSYPVKTGLEGIVSIAAGRQMFKSNLPLNAANSVVKTEGDSTFAFSESVQNDPRYITGALTSGGILKVWSNGSFDADATENKQTVTDIVFPGNPNNPYNKFAAVYSGYGNNLFAITRLGKVVRIEYDDSAANKYKLTVYDAFNSEMPSSDADNSKRINHWSIAGEAENDVRFMSIRSDAEANSKYPSLGSFTFYIDKGVANRNTVLMNGHNVDGVNSVNMVDETIVSLSGADGEMPYNNGVEGYSRNSLVTTNDSGSAYRILDPDSDDDITFIPTTSGDTPVLPSDISFKFMFTPYGSTTASELTEEQCAHMFDYTVVKDSSYGVGINITPKHSTQEGTVTMSFYVARFDCKDGYRISNGQATDNADYYDFKKTSVTFSIDNTEPYKNFVSFRTENGPYYNVDRPGSAAIPLLDPNNESNSRYSVAVQDVTSGVEVLTSLLAGNDNAELLSVLRTAVLTQMSLEAGFPSSSKIDTGNLEYYLGADASKFYNNKYQFLFEDRDADRIRITGDVLGSLFGTSGSQNAVTATLGTNTVRLDFEATGIDKNDILNKIALNFDNRYGLYDFAIDDGGNSLSFKYDYVMFTANGTVGSLTYNEAEDRANVDGYTATQEGGGEYISFNLRFTEYSRFQSRPDDGAKGYQIDIRESKETTGAWDNFAAVFSQATLRMTYRNETYYGSSEGGKNVVLLENDTQLIVGSTYTVSLDCFMKRSNDIVFSYNNVRGSYDGFNSQFPNELGGEGSYVTLNESTIVIAPKSKHNIEFTVTIQRFFGDGYTKAFNHDDEKIYLTFVFDNVQDISFTQIEANVNNTYKVTHEGIIDILSNESAINAGHPLISTTADRSILTITSLKSSNSSVLSVPTTVPAGTTSFTVTPVSAGNARVEFVVSVYDRSIRISLNFNVYGTAYIDASDKIALTETSYVYIGSLKSQLINAYNFDTDIANYGVITSDVTEGALLPNAIYFTKYDTTTLTESPMPEGQVKPFFVGSVSFVDAGTASPRIRVTLDPDANDMTGTYRMHVRFVSCDSTGAPRYATYADAEASDTPVVEIAQLIESAKLIAKDASGAPLKVEVDCDNPYAGNESSKKTDWYMEGSNTNAVVHIPVYYLLHSAGISNPDEFGVFLVAFPSVDASQYLRYSMSSAKDEVIITPLYNTPYLEETQEYDYITVNVSVRSTGLVSENRTVSFRLSLKGISTTLPVEDYRMIWLVAFFASMGFLLIIFLIRMIVYWRRRANQRALIKRNQELIKLRDRVHNRASAASRDQVVKSKLKMEDPKYAKMFNEMKKERNGDPGITLENADGGLPDPFGAGGKKGKKKKKGGKKSMAELKAELAAKKAAFAQAQNGGPQGGFGVSPQGGFVSPAAGFGEGFASPDAGFGGGDGFASPADEYASQSIDGDAIIFDSPDTDSQG